MKEKKKILTALLFSMMAVVFVRCSEDDDPTSGTNPELDILVKIEAIQDGEEGGRSVKFKISLVDSDDEAVTNITGESLTATATFSGTSDQGDFDTDFVSEVSIANNSSSTTVELMVADDSEVEEEETLTLTLSAASVGDIDIASATAKITDNDQGGGNQTSSVDISVLADKFYHSTAVTFTFDDEWVTITSKDLPDHKSMYYDANDPLYDAYDEPNNPDFKKNPGSIGEQNLVFKLPRYPEEASSKSSPELGPMGVTINSVAFFNQEAGPGDDIFEEENTFDQYEGHPAGDLYHYHVDPIWLTSEMTGADNEAFLGLLLDGFPVYGPFEDGVEMTNDDLDDYHGHFGVTADFPDGIYHYHITEEYPWINGDAFYGVTGTITQ